MSLRAFLSAALLVYALAFAAVSYLHPHGWSARHCAEALDISLILLTLSAFVAPIKTPRRS